VPNIWRAPTDNDGMPAELDAEAYEPVPMKRGAGRELGWIVLPPQPSRLYAAAAWLIVWWWI